MARSNLKSAFETPVAQRRKHSWIIGVVLSVFSIGIVVGGLYFLQYLRRERLRDPYAPTQNGLTLIAVHASDFTPYQKDARGVRNLFAYPTVEVALPRKAKLGVKHLVGPILPKLTVLVVHQVEKQSIPVSSTVPVGAGKPKEEWNRE